MKWQIILKVQGLLLIILSIMMIFPLLFSLYYKGNDTFAISLALIITLAVGLLLAVTCKVKRNIKAKEGFIIVSLGWILASLFGGLPFYIHGSFGSYINCVFEAMSGFTTTGATILTGIENIPKGLLFWRSLTHWLGGMGIILLTIAILPFFGIISGHLYKAEVPGPTKDKISPKIKDTAKILWLIYTGLTVLETILLMFGGMDLYNALCHTFGTLATGGFSTLNSSIAGFDNLYIEIVIIVFMYLAGVNFLLHFYLIKRKFKDFIKDREWRFYTSVLLIAITAITLNLFLNNTDPHFMMKNEISGEFKNNIFMALRAAAFQTVSITTTTGFCTADFNMWPSFSRILLVFMMFFGGSAGSTGGGMKQIRVLIIFKKVLNEIKKMAHPKAIFYVKVGKNHIPQPIVSQVTGFVILFILLFSGVTLFLAFMGYDLITSFSASIATLGNIGPGLARVGAVENYAFFDPLSKVVLAFSMLLGRLEIYSVLLFFYSITERR